jgi:hypothetical protein
MRPKFLAIKMERQLHDLQRRTAQIEFISEINNARFRQHRALKNYLQRKGNRNEQKLVKLNSATNRELQRTKACKAEFCNEKGTATNKSLQH